MPDLGWKMLGFNQTPNINAVGRPGKGIPHASGHSVFYIRTDGCFQNVWIDKR